MALIDFDDDETRNRLYVQPSPDGDPDPRTPGDPSGGGFPPPAPPPGPSAPPPTSGGGAQDTSAQVRDLYQSLLGRAPDARELESDTENYAKYGADQLRSNLRERAAPVPGYQTNVPGAGDAIASAMGRAQAGGGFRAGRTSFGGNFPGDQFSDPYTKALEDLAKQHLAAIQQPQTNPALDKLLAFLDTRFGELSGSPGYSPAEQALLRTQALEPIERDRAAAQRRSLERTAARGFLPSSGLAELDSREADLAYDRLRGEAQRDLGINAINKRDRDLAQALTLGQISGVQIPQQQRVEDQQRRNESVALAQLLYNLPRQAMLDANQIVGGSPMPQNLLGESVQLMQAQEAQRRYNQQQNQQFWAQIGDVLSGLFE